MGGLCWFCHPPPPQGVVWGGGTGRIGRGSHPPSLGGHSSVKPPRSLKLGGWGGLAPPAMEGRGEGDTMPWTPPPKIPLPGVGTAPCRGGKTPQNSPPCTPAVPDPPSSADPVLGRGGCGWEGGGGVPVQRGGLPVLGGVPVQGEWEGLENGRGGPSPGEGGGRGGGQQISHVTYF